MSTRAGILTVLAQHWTYLTDHLVLFLDAGSPGTLTLSGSRVDTWSDVLGSGRSLSTGSQGTAKNPAWDGSLFGGLGGVQFNRSSAQYLESTTPLTELNWSTGFTILLAGTRTSKDSFFALGDSASLRCVFGAGIGNRLGVGTECISAHGFPLNNPCVMGITYDGTSASFLCNGFQYSATEGTYSSGSGPFGKLQLGGLIPGGTSDLQVAGMLVYSQPLTARQSKLASRALANIYGFTSLPDPTFNLIVDGNSLAVGQISAGNWTMTDGIEAIPLTPMDYVNVSRSGLTTSDLATRAPSLVYPLLSPRAPASRRIVIVWEITNDLASGSTDVQAYAHLKSYCQSLSANGFRVIVGTCLPRSNSGLVAGFETARTSVNAMILANAISEGWAQGIADFGGDTTIGVSGASNDPSLYGDKIHLTSAGHALAATILTPVVQSVSA